MNNNNKQQNPNKIKANKQNTTTQNQPTKQTNPKTKPQHIMKQNFIPGSVRLQ